MADVIVIGCGPAGISAALYVLRGGVSVTVVGKDEGALGKAEKINNYYGIHEGMKGTDLVRSGIEQVEEMGAQVLREEVVGLGFEEFLVVHTAKRTLKAKAVILATGATRQSVALEGLAQFEGKGISYCAMCDAFFYRGKDVAVLGCCDYAAHEVNDLLPVVKSVTLLTNGEAVTAKVLDCVPVIKTKIQKFTGEDVLQQVEFEDGATLAVSGVFVAIGVAGSSALAQKVGAQTEGQSIVVDSNMGTNVPGLFAAGDCTGGLLQIAKAVGEGAKAGISAVKYARNVTPV